MNIAILMGRMVKDPELQYTSNGKAVTKFTLAVKREFNREEADFINCIAWEKRAETIAEYFKKGQRIAIQGRIKVSNYDKNGNTVWKTDIIVDKFEFIESNNNNSQNEDSKKQYNDDDKFPF